MDRRLLIGLCALVAMLASGCDAAAQEGWPLAFVGPDRQVYTIGAAGGAPRRVSDTSLAPPRGVAEVVYVWPTWSPDGAWLAYIRHHRGSDGRLASAVVVSRPDGAAARALFETSPEMGPITPFFLNWSPDSGWISVGAQGRPLVHLLLLDATGTVPPQQVVSASPLFHAWGPDSRSLLVHLYGDGRHSPQAEVASYHLDHGWDERFVVPARPLGFHAPGWSPDGQRVALAVSQSPDDARVVVFDTRGGTPTTLLSVQGNPAFSWSPDGSHLAVALRDHDGAPFFSGLAVIRVADGQVRRVATEDSLSAFFWSPRSDRLAYAVLQGPRNPGVAWWVADLEGGRNVKLASYIPDDESFYVLTFFDQFAQSMSPWSPDGRWLAFSGAQPGAEDDRDLVWLVPADGSAPPHPLSEGRMPSWPAARRH